MTRSTRVPDSALGMKFCDTIDIDQDAHRLYAGDNWSGGVDVFDITTPEAKYLTTAKTGGGVYGICVAPELRLVFAGLSASRVAAIDIDPTSPTLHTVVARIETGGHGSADLIEYIPSLKKVYVANHHDAFCTAIDAVTKRVVKRIDGLGRELEQPRFNSRDGMVYLTSRGDNALHQIDPKTDTLVRTIDVVDPCNPNGMAIDPVTNQALLACGNKERPHTVIWDLDTQSVARVIDESGCGDGAIYEPTIDRFFFAANGYTGGPVLGVFGGEPARFLANVPTKRGSSWVAYDRTNKLIYVPAVEDGKPALLSFPLPDAAR